MKATRVCKVCGAEFEVDDCPSRSRFGTCCSRECQYAALRIPLETAFWAKVNKTEGCWLWLSSTAPFGHGMFTHRSQTPKTQRAHRVAWKLTRGPIPSGLLVCHHCDVPACVNPGHLFIGTMKDNAMDAAKKGRLAQQKDKAKYVLAARKKSKLTAEDVIAIRAELGARNGARIGRKYGVSKGVISAIRTGKTWSDGVVS